MKKSLFYLLWIGTIFFGCYAIQAQQFYDPRDFIWINEVMVEPLPDTTNHCIQSMYIADDPECGREWVELFNSHPCDSIDLSTYMFGGANQGQNYVTINLPEGTKIPPLGFLVIGGGDPAIQDFVDLNMNTICLLYTSPSPRDKRQSRMPSSA